MDIGTLCSSSRPLLFSFVHRHYVNVNTNSGLMAGAMPRVYSMGPSAMCMLSLFDILKRFAAKPDSSLPIPPLT
jgi:hypothetical protein